MRLGVSGFAESLVVIRPELLVLLDEVNQIIGNRLCVDGVHVSRLLLIGYHVPVIAALIVTVVYLSHR